MIYDIPTYHIEYDKSEISRAIMCAFNYVEQTDDIVGEIYANPILMKEIVKAFIDDVEFDYIPEGIGRFKGAYLKFIPSIKENVITFITYSKSFRLKMELI
jgi:hypothetical protein